MKTFFFLGLATATVLLLTMFASHSMADDQQPRQMVGGYTPVENAMDDQRIQQAATFALTALSKDDREIPHYSFMETIKTSAPETFSSSVRVIRAFQQIVAGLNYRLVLAIVNPQGACQGAFAVTVYDHFGDLSVTRWGKEIECSRAMAALENQDLENAHAEHFNGR